MSRPAGECIPVVFPTSATYDENDLAEKDKSKPEHQQSGDEERVVWYRQTINNACGLYGLLHAVSNGGAREYIIPDSHLDKLLKKCTQLGPAERATALEDDERLEAAYKEVAFQGDSDVPDDPEEEVDFHYVCFVKSHKDGHLYELDGDRKGPVDWGVFTDEDLLSEKGLRVIREFVGQVEKDGGGFSLLALATE